MTSDRSSTGGAIVPLAHIERRILTIRGHKVILDADLAELYGVATKRLNEQVRRNAERFPTDFAFQLTREEHDALRSQIATIEKGRGKHRKYLPWVFTEHGAIMAANVLNSGRAVEVSVVVVRAFVRLRQMLSTHRELAQKLAELEERIGAHDETIQAILAAIHHLMEAPPEPPKERIGFVPRRRDAAQG